MPERRNASRPLTNKTCKEISDLVLAYLADKLRPKTKKDFKTHLKICPDCLSFLNTYKKTVTTTRSLDVAKMPARVRDNILSFLRKRTGRISAALIFILTRLAA